MSSRLTVVLVSLLLAAPAVIFWLGLVIVPAGFAIFCPKECECHTLYYSVECNGPSFTAVPSIPLRDIRHFALFGNNITLLKRDSFVELTELESLRLWKSGLKAIELGAFNGLAELRELIIGVNKISALIPGTFENLSKLEVLNLGDNGLEHLDVELFSGLVNLRYILLTSNNLQYLHPNTFLGLPNIKHVILYDNHRLQIPTDRPFINSHSLPSLSISHCNISSLSVETFANVSGLERLDLRHNNLMTIDINILTALPKLSEIFLGRNPLQCDCQLQEVWRLCEDRNIETAVWDYVPVCDTPEEVKGMWWGVLEKGECLQGDIEYCGDYRNTSYSYTDTERLDFYEKKVKFLKQYQLPIYAFPFIFGTTSNVILLIIIICNKDMRTVPNMYIVNLAISDIIYLTVLFFDACAIRTSDTWLDGDFMCRFTPFCRRLSVGLSAYSVAMLSIQRYRVTVNPLHNHVSSPPTWRSTVATICGVWIVATLFAVPSAISMYICDVVLLGGLQTYYKRVVIFELLVSCVIPLCVVFFTYIMTALHHVENYGSSSEGTQIPQFESRRNTAKIVVGLTVVLLISFVPYHAAWTYYIWTGRVTILDVEFAHGFVYSTYKLQNTYLTLTCLLLINSCLNPVALFCTSSPFRQHLKRCLTCFCKTNSAPNDIELATRN